MDEAELLRLRRVRESNPLHLPRLDSVFSLTPRPPHPVAAALPLPLSSRCSGPVSVFLLLLLSPLQIAVTGTPTASTALAIVFMLALLLNHFVVWLVSCLTLLVVVTDSDDCR